MGGFGSGKPRTRKLISDHLSLDVRWMNRQGWFKNRGAKIVSWTRNGTPCGQINLIVGVDSICLICSISRNDGPWEEKNVTIKIVKTPCRLGGVQHWFECPICGRSVSTLYLLDSWYCRRCGNLAYPTENEDQLGRLQSKANKLKKKLGQEYWIKPKGMHGKTYERLKNAYFDAEEKAEIVFVKEVEKLVNRDSTPFGKT